MCSADPKELAKKSLIIMRKLCDGNGATADSVQIKEARGEILEMVGITHLELNHSTEQARKAGKHIQGTLLPNAQMLKGEIDKSITKMGKNDDARKVITGKLLSRPDKGFSSHGEEIDLTEFGMEYTTHDPCGSCQGQGATTCKRCQGRCQETCTQCHAKTMIPCRKCSGNGFTMGQDNKQQKCNFCFGHRQVACPLCQKRGTIKCRICNGAGQTKCDSCNGSGAFSVFTLLKVKIKTLFEMDRTSVPAPVVYAIENNGDKLVSQKHIDLISAESVKREDGGMAIHYKAKFPYGDLVFNVNGKPITAHLFGNRGKMLKLKPFLEDMIEPGIGHLERAARGDGTVANQIKKASQYKLIASALLFVSSMPMKKAFIALKKKYPMGISNDALMQIIKQSDQALGNVTRKPRYIGLSVGLGLTALIMSALYLTKTYASLVIKLPNLMFEVVLAAGLIGLTGYGSKLIIKKFADKARTQAIGHLMASNTKMVAPAKTRTSGLYAYIGAAVILLIVSEITRHVGLAAPAWYPIK